MAAKLDPIFLHDLMAYAEKDQAPITAAIMERVARNGLPIVFFHDCDKVPVAFEKHANHGTLKKAFKLLPDGRVRGVKSIGETVYVGKSAATYLNFLGLLKSSEYDMLKG